MHHRFQFVKTIRAFSKDVKNQVNFAGRLFGHGKEKAPTRNVGAAKWFSLALRSVKNAETAAWNKRGDFTATEAHADIGRKHGVIRQSGNIRRRIDWIFRENLRLVVRRKRSRHDFKGADPGASEAAIKAMQK